MSKKNKKAKNHRKNEITKGIFTVLEKEQDKSFNYKQIAAKIGVTDAHERNMLIQRLVQLKEKMLQNIVVPTKIKLRKQVV